MKKTYRLLRAIIVVWILLTISAPGVGGQAANLLSEDTPQRQAEIVVSITEFEWWVIRWADNKVVCQVFIDHEGLPAAQEILNQCGRTVYDLWQATPPCPEGETSDCEGVYLHQVSSQPAEEVITVDLPPPTVWVTLSGCIPTIPDNRCPAIPNLLLTGEELLPNEHITAIHAEMDGRSFTCEEEICEIPLRPTTRDGMTVTFWAESSFSDSSATYTAWVRVVDSGVVDQPGGAGWFVDVISTQWRGRPTATCAQTWQTFPPVGGPPGWLSTPEVPELLATDEPLMFLAGRLISHGVVDAADCPQGGLLPNGYANACGMERAQPIVSEWQNQFDARIMEVALETGVPAQLMKNLFAQESQFWPGAFNGLDHLGLGHITENGVEVLLLWNRSFFDQFCPLVLDGSTCARGYIYLDKDQQATLRGALAMQANTECPECPAGIDLTQANFSIDLFAQTLLANCDQVGQIVFNASDQAPGAVAQYEDLWRFTLANYHAGPGCLSYAVHSAWNQGDPLTWDNVSRFFTPVCQGVVGYVENVAR